MTDKELLELAAKAAGYRFDSTEPFEIAQEHKGGTNWFEWNPLIDDGDALRLAVRMDFAVDWSIPGRVQCAGQRGTGLEEYHAEHNGDPYAATSRAIVRAAAEIGKSMP